MGKRPSYGTLVLLIIFCELLLSISAFAQTATKPLPRGALTIVYADLRSTKFDDKCGIPEHYYDKVAERAVSSHGVPGFTAKGDIEVRVTYAVSYDEPGICLVDVNVEAGYAQHLLHPWGAVSLAWVRLCRADEHFGGTPVDTRQKLAQSMTQAINVCMSSFL